jgi:hypothetical protein
MKKLITLLFISGLFFAACSSEPQPTESKLTTEEEKAIEETMKADQQAMDSLENAIMKQIEADSLIKE